MRFSLSRLLPLLLPLVQMASGGALPDLATTFPSLRLVGSFSIGLEGGSAPISFSHNVEFPLASLGQGLLDWATPITAMPAQPRISSTTSDDHPVDQIKDVIMLGHPDAMLQSGNLAEEIIIERSDESNVGVSSNNENNMQLELRRQDSSEPTLPSKNKLISKKRKLVAFESASKRTKVEEDRAKEQQVTSRGKHKKGDDNKSKKHKKRPNKSSESCRHCRHCCKQDRN